MFCSPVGVGCHWGKSFTLFVSSFKQFSIFCTGLSFSSFGTFLKMSDILRILCYFSQLLRMAPKITFKKKRKLYNTFFSYHSEHKEDCASTLLPTRRYHQRMAGYIFSSSHNYSVTTRLEGSPQSKLDTFISIALAKCSALQRSGPCRVGSTGRWLFYPNEEISIE